MTVVAVCSPAGAGAATVTSLYLAAALAATRGVVLAECDDSGGDLAAWAQLSLSPGWASAVAGRDRTFDGLLRHAQRLPSGLTVLVAPSRPVAAATAVASAATMFGPVIASAPDAITVADCGRIATASPAWVGSAALTLLVIRQNAVAAAPNVALVDRALEALDVLGSSAHKVGVVLAGERPYRAAEVEQALGTPLFALLPDDPHGAAIALGGWTVARRATRTALGRATATLAGRVDRLVGPRAAPGTERGSETTEQVVTSGRGAP